ncbi:MAG TPA: ATP-dependent helicase [Geminicoccaceae bacterium]|nr:ATP-dependent helicase [Geminicoccaceae bacterium]
MHSASHHTTLNPQQRAAVAFGVPADGRLEPGPPLLVIAGAGSGKTNTLAHRVAHLILHGADPRRILLLTFTRRAAEAMIRRAGQVCEQLRSGPSVPAAIPWSGTFHAVGARMLRLYAEQIGLDPGFTVLDRSDAADLIDLVRDEQGLSQQDRRFPRKTTCLAIYSYAVNAGQRLDAVLRKAFPWCSDWESELKSLFAGYVEAKQRQSVLDYDDLLLYWQQLMAVPALAADVGARFDYVLVDEYQDTNALQAAILLAMKPDGRGVTVVGDDAQAIYGFRAASVRNILDFPNSFDPPAAIATLEQNYRSTQPILAAANAVIGLAQERFTKNLFSERPSRQKPLLVTVRDEAGQVDYVVGRILESREAGIALRRQAVLCRASHHSGALEVELARRNIPFVKYGGLKFLEAAHVKDVLAILRWAENPRDRVAAYRTLQLLQGVGPATARRAVERLEAQRHDFAALADFPAPAAAAELWPGLVRLMRDLAAGGAWQGQLGRVRAFYDPLLAALYEFPWARQADLDQLEQIAASHPSRERFLCDLTLDPPQGIGDEAGPPHRDEDYLVLSTIHSAKGQEWQAVYILNVVDGCIPSDMATDTAAEIEEERRLLYVAMTRARDELHLIQPQRFYAHGQSRHGDRYVSAPRTRFIPDALIDRFELLRHGLAAPAWPGETCKAVAARVDLGARLRAMWR